MAGSGPAPVPLSEKPGGGGRPGGSWPGAGPAPGGRGGRPGGSWPGAGPAPGGRGGRPGGSWPGAGPAPGGSGGSWPGAGWANAAAESDASQKSAMPVRANPGPRWISATLFM